MTENTENQTEPEAITDNESANEQAQQSTVEEELPQVEADPLAVLQQEIAELKDKYLRLFADFENFRRRTSKERIELMSSAGEDILKSVLPVLDDFERGLASMEASTEVEPLKEGVLLVYNKLFKTLEQKGLKPMTSKGEQFDADLHESITQFPAGDENKGKVVDEIEKGYTLNDKVIRYAKVVVGM